MEAARTGKRVDHIQSAVGAEGQSLRPPERRGDGRDLAASIDLVDGIVGAKGWRGDVQLAFGAHGEMKGGDAWRERGEGRRAAITYAEDRAGPVADKHPPFLVERDAAGDTEIRGDLLGRAIRGDPVHRALEAARHIEPRIWSAGHRGRVDDTRGERLARPLRRDAEDGHRRFLSSRPAVG